MQSQTENGLTYKIRQLEDYLEVEYPNKKLKIHDFLDDLNDIKTNLSVLGLLNYLVEMYNDGVSAKDIVRDVSKTQKIFNIASEYIASTEQDHNILLLSQEIHSLIIKHLDKALKLYKREYCL